MPGNALCVLVNIITASTIWTYYMRINDGYSDDFNYLNLIQKDEHEIPFHGHEAANT